MLPLAVLLKGMGYRVSGSDRSREQGRTPEKFTWIESQGITLYPQDGSGVKDGIDAVVISKAVEDTVPDIAAARAGGIPILKRVDVLIDMFNAAQKRIAISGTSGKTTTTGMIAFILKEAGLDPSVMNGGIFRNYVDENPYSTAFVGQSGVFVSEIDESDGIEAVCRFSPDIAIIHNISLDHQPMEELQRMFAGFLARTSCAVANAQDPVVMDMVKGFGGKVINYSAGVEDADIRATDIVPRPDGTDSKITAFGKNFNLRLIVPGAHNVSNALAAMAAAHAVGVSPEQSADILSRFKGIKRRMDVIGTVGGITVMDDFAHNPDKVAATLTTLKEFSGRLLIFFQPHGYGFLKVVGKELAESFATHLGAEDVLYLVEPFYAGGTVDRSVGAAHLAHDIQSKGRNAVLMDGRAVIKDAILQTAKSGDRVIVMGARDDSLSDFAREILNALS